MFGKSTLATEISGLFLNAPSHEPAPDHQHGETSCGPASLAWALSAAMSHLGAGTPLDLQEIIRQELPGLTDLSRLHAAVMRLTPLLANWSVGVQEAVFGCINADSIVSFARRLPRSDAVVLDLAPVTGSVGHVVAIDQTHQGYLYDPSIRFQASEHLVAVAGEHEVLWARRGRRALVVRVGVLGTAR